MPARHLSRRTLRFPIRGISGTLLRSELINFGASVGDLVDPRVDHIGHVFGTAFDVFGIFTLEQFINRLPEKL